MKRFLMVLLFLACSIHGQDETHVVSQTRTFTIQPVFQSWTSDFLGTVTEISTPVEIYYPFNRWWSVDITAGQASAYGKDLTSISGLSDTQILLNYYLESSNLVFNVGVNAPSGKKELKINEFNTTALLSQNLLSFETPVFGQGFNWAPGLTWALPLSGTVVLGFGASYQTKGAYKPIDKMSESYKPGNELLITTGLDVRTGETGSFSFDLIWTRYQADKVGSSDIFRAGSKIIVATQYQKFIGRDLLWLSMRYRSRSKNHVIISGTSTEVSKTQPDEFECMGLYHWFISQRFSWNFSSEIRILQKAALFDRVYVFEVGTGPEWKISPSMTIPVKVNIGWGKFGNQQTLTGTEIRIGMEYQF